ncbi:MAG: hypothetical protein AB7S71_01405 [Dongiaceae bacterium]
MNLATLRRKARAMAAPKAEWIGRSLYSIGRYGIFDINGGLWSISHIVERLIPAERRAMAEIADTADLLLIDDRTYIVAQVSPATVDALAAFDAQGEDLEVDNDDKCQAEDDSGSSWRSETEDDEDDDPGEDNGDDEHGDGECGFGNPMMAGGFQGVRVIGRAPDRREEELPPVGGEAFTDDQLRDPDGRPVEFVPVR